MLLKRVQPASAELAVQAAWHSHQGGRGKIAEFPVARGDILLGGLR